MSWDRKQREEISQWTGIVLSLVVITLLLISWSIL